MAGVVKEMQKAYKEQGEKKGGSSADKAERVGRSFALFLELDSPQLFF